jgi:hypothetical protein
LWPARVLFEAHHTNPELKKTALTAIRLIALSGCLALAACGGKRDKPAFEEAFDSLTAGCNNCHRTMKFGFNVVRRPTTDAFPNQIFSLPAATP